MDELTFCPHCDAGFQVIWDSVSIWPATEPTYCPFCGLEFEYDA